MSWLNDTEWRDRFLIRFKQRPSAQLMAFINTEIAWAVQRERDRLTRRTPPPLPSKDVSEERIREAFKSLAKMASENKEEQEALYVRLCRQLQPYA
jgi:hypothetical protein